MIRFYCEELRLKVSLSEDRIYIYGPCPNNDHSLISPKFTRDLLSKILSEVPNRVSDVYRIDKTYYRYGKVEVKLRSYHYLIYRFPLEEGNPTNHPAVLDNFHSQVNWFRNL